MIELQLPCLLWFAGEEARNEEQVGISQSATNGRRKHKFRASQGSSVVAGTCCSIVVCACSDEQNKLIGSFPPRLIELFVFRTKREEKIERGGKLFLL